MLDHWIKAVVLIVSAGLMACAPGEPEEQGYTSLAGENIRLSDQLGKVVLVNYWAEWCAPCRQEIPELNALQEQFPQQVRIFGVNFDGVTGDRLKQQVEAMDIGFTQLEQDPRGVFAVAPSGVLPETLVIDRNGQFQQLLLGPQSLESLQHIVANLPEQTGE